METKGVTCKIPLDLHNRITEEIRQKESTMSKFIEQIILEHYAKGVATMGKTRTMAFQVSEELFQQIKEYLARYEQTYLAERVDGVVLALVDQMFQQIKQEPYDRSIEQRIRQQDAEWNRKKQAAEKKIQAARHKQQRYEEEIVRCLDGQSAFSEATLARLIQQAEAEVQQVKNEYTALLKDNSSRTTVQQIRKYYDEFLGWANEFDLASIPRKRTILAQLLERVELGRGYQVRIVVRGSYRQFLAAQM